jgi:serine/threonine-protein kinase
MEVGQRVGDYEILAILGAGGMGRVYKVRNVISNREEAMKILLPDFAAEPELAARFMAEIRTLAGLDHPNIAQLRTAFQYEKEFVMVMEFVEGTTLDHMAAHAPIPLDQVLEYSTQVLSALSFAHSRGVTHRDIKPANIMVTSHGLVKLMDFGIAKSASDANMQLTRPGMTMGSVYYMSPEQVRGGTVDARSDIYSFGVTLYEMLTGRKPFNADTSYSVLYAQMNEAPTPPVEVNPALPAELNNIVLRAMVKAPEGRFQTAEEFRNALKALRKGQAAEPGPVPGPAPQAAAFAVGSLAATAAPQAGGFTPVPISATAATSQPQGFTPVAVPVVNASTPPPSFGPVAVPSQATAPGTGKSHRGLWIGLGALAAILALVAVAMVLPHVFATHASQKPAAPDAQTAAATPAPEAPAAPQSPAATDATQQPATPGTTTPDATQAAQSTASQPSATGSTSQVPPVHKPRQTGGLNAQSASGTSGSGSTTPPAPAGPSAQEIREAHDRLMNLNARAEAASSGVQQIRSQQQAQGLDLRGDILGAMSRMNTLLGEAERAISAGDLNAAKEYMDRADREVTTLEKFLGR